MPLSRLYMFLLERISFLAPGNLPKQPRQVSLERRLKHMPGCLATLMTLTATTVLALCTSTATCLRVLEQAHRDTRTITARFIQTKRLSLLDEPLVSTGSFAFKHPDRVLWRVEKPQPTTVVITGNQVRVPGLPERDRRALALGRFPPMFSQLGALFTGSVEGTKEDFDVTAQEQGAAIQVKLVSREQPGIGVFRTVYLTFSVDDLLVHEIRLENDLGDSLDISLSQVRRNGDVPDSTFDLEAYQ